MEKSMNKEYILNGSIQMRSLESSTGNNLNEINPDSRIVCGYAVRFDCESQNIGWIEVIHRGAITEETIMQSDIFARLNHDENTVLARSRYGEGSLALELRDDGLYYEFEAPHTAVGDELLEHLKRGEITSSSFAFTLPEDGTGAKFYRDGEVLRRDITKIDKLYDVSPVYEPAYPDASCMKRSKEIMDRSTEINSMYDSMINDLESYKI